MAYLGTKCKKSYRKDFRMNNLKKVNLLNNYKYDIFSIGFLCILIYLYSMQFLGFDLSNIFNLPLAYPFHNPLAFSDNYLGLL